MNEYGRICLSLAGHLDPEELAGAVDLASDQDQPTWIVDVNGGKVAAIVPVEVLEYHDAWQASVLRPSWAGKHRGGVND